MVENDLNKVLDIPVGKLGIIGMAGCEEITDKIDRFIVDWRSQRTLGVDGNMDFGGYHKESYKVEVCCPRFGSGEAKGLIKQSIRGYDLYIICDVFNYGITYKMYGKEVPMSPDDHFQDLKRIIAAAGGKARRITVIMTMLYEGRQHRKTSRESLDCAMALNELRSMGVENIITFDAHDPRVQNAVPLISFENIQPIYQFIKALINNVPDIRLNSENAMIISPDEGGMSRSIYYSSILGLDLGMFYKRRDYTRIVNGKNPIIEHEFLGDQVDGKDLIIVDDMISSGESTLDIAKQLKKQNARRIFICASFGLFCEGLERFDEAYKEGIISKVFTTNLIYRSPELRKREWYQEVDLSKYIAYIVDILNHDRSTSSILNPSERINNFLKKTGQR